MDIKRHKNTFIVILKEIYSDKVLRSVLGFKGGTCAMLFYDLPRFSVDLDFDLIDEEKKEMVFERLKQILPKFGRVMEAADKHYTLFFLINYGYGERNLKIEISKRPAKSEFLLKNYLGISMLVMSQEDMVACKIAALLTRKKFANRDVFDTWFFLKNNWGINDKLLEKKSGMKLIFALKKVQKMVENLKDNQILSGLGELIDEKQKAWVKENLKKELVFEIRKQLAVTG